MEGARVTSVISNHCIRTRLLVFKNFFSNNRVCDAEYYLQILCGCLSPGSAVGQDLRPFVVYPPSCRGGGFYTTGFKFCFCKPNRKTYVKEYGAGADHQYNPKRRNL